MGRLINAAEKMAGTTKNNARPSTKMAKPPAPVFGRGNANTAKSQPAKAAKE